MGLVLLLLSNIFLGIDAHAQNTGINNKAPGADKILVAGNMAVRTSTSTPAAQRILVPGSVNASGSQLQQTDAFLMYHSSGLMVKQTSDNNWNGIYVGPAAARLDCALRSETNAHFTISFLYVVGKGFTLLGAPVNCALVGSDVNYFTITAGLRSYTFALTSGAAAGTIDINVSAFPTTPTWWTQGTIRSIPILD